MPYRSWITVFFPTPLIFHYHLPLKSKPNLGPHVGYSVRLGKVFLPEQFTKNQKQSRAARGLQRTFWDCARQNYSQKNQTQSGAARGLQRTFGDCSHKNNSLKNQSQPRNARGWKRTFFAHFLERTIY